MAFGVLAGQITVIFLEVLLGYVGARSGIIKDRDSKFLSDFIMKLLLPCTMLAGAAVDGEPELLTQAGVLFVLLLALFVVTTGLCRLSSWLHHDTPGKYAVLVGTAAMPNCGFIGLPLCSALLGTARGTVFAGMAMASYNVWFFTYVCACSAPARRSGSRPSSPPPTLPRWLCWCCWPPAGGCPHRCNSSAVRWAAAPPRWRL